MPGHDIQDGQQFVESLGVRILVDPDVTSPRLIRQLRKDGYEAEEAHGLRRVVAPGDRVLELGAGIGFISSFIHRHLEPESTLSVEANPMLIDFIGRVHAANGVTAARVLNAVLLSDTAERPADGTVPFYVADPLWSSSLVRDPALQCTEVRTPALRLSEVIAEYDPAVIVCDIEGGETELFEAADFGNVRSIFMELHRNKYGGVGIRKVFDDLHRHDFAMNPRVAIPRQVLFERLRKRDRGKYRS